MITALLTLASLLAHAGEHAGIPVDAVGVLGEPVFLEPGWSAPILDDQRGHVRVYVHRDPDDVSAWFASWSAKAGDLPPLPLGAQESVGNGHTIAAFRDGNIAVVVERPGGGALDLATRLMLSVEDDVPWPQPPMVHVNGAQVSVDGMWTNVAIRPAPRVDPNTFVPRPVRVVPLSTNAVLLGDEPTRLRVVVWDRYGRPAYTDWAQPAIVGNR